MSDRRRGDGYRERRRSRSRSPRNRRYPDSSMTFDDSREDERKNFLMQINNSQTQRRELNHLAKQISNIFYDGIQPLPLYKQRAYAEEKRDIAYRSFLPSKKPSKQVRNSKAETPTPSQSSQHSLNSSDHQVDAENSESSSKSQTSEQNQPSIQDIVRDLTSWHPEQVSPLPTVLRDMDTQEDDDDDDGEDGMNNAESHGDKTMNGGGSLNTEVDGEVVNGGAEKENKSDSHLDDDESMHHDQNTKQNHARIHQHESRNEEGGHETSQAVSTSPKATSPKPPQRRKRKAGTSPDVHRKKIKPDAAKPGKNSKKMVKQDAEALMAIGQDSSTKTSTDTTETALTGIDKRSTSKQKATSPKSGSAISKNSSTSSSNTKDGKKVKKNIESKDAAKSSKSRTVSKPRKEEEETLMTTLKKPRQTEAQQGNKKPKKTGQNRKDESNKKQLSSSSPSTVVPKSKPVPLFRQKPNVFRDLKTEIQTILKLPESVYEKQARDLKHQGDAVKTNPSKAALHYLESTITFMKAVRKLMGEQPSKIVASKSSYERALRYCRDSVTFISALKSHGKALGKRDGDRFSDGVHTAAFRISALFAYQASQLSAMKQENYNRIVQGFIKEQHSERGRAALKPSAAIASNLTLQPHQASNSGKSPHSPQSTASGNSGSDYGQPATMAGGQLGQVVMDGNIFRCVTMLSRSIDDAWRAKNEWKLSYMTASMCGMSEVKDVILHHCHGTDLPPSLDLTKCLEEATDLINVLHHVLAQDPQLRS